MVLDMLAGIMPALSPDGVRQYRGAIRMGDIPAVSPGREATARSVSARIRVSAAWLNSMLPLMLPVGRTWGGRPVMSPNEMGLCAAGDVLPSSRLPIDPWA